MSPRARRVARAVAARPKRRIRLDNDERRRQLLELAKKAFTDRSYDDVSIDDLAREAKISKGLLYHYFPTKRDLYVAGLREIADELVVRMEAIPTNLAPVDAIREGLDAYLDHISHHARAYVALMRGGIGSDPEVAVVIEDVRTRLADRFLEGTVFQQLVGTPKFHVFARGWIGFVEGATIDWCANPRMSLVELRDLLGQLMLGVMTAFAPHLAG